MQTPPLIQRPRIRRLFVHCRRWGIPSLMFRAALPVFAPTQGTDPWDNAVNALRTAFTETIDQVSACAE